MLENKNVLTTSENMLPKVISKSLLSTTCLSAFLDKIMIKIGRELISR
jgi:hypothetical protein